MPVVSLPVTIASSPVWYAGCCSSGMTKCEHLQPRSSRRRLMQLRAPKTVRTQEMESSKGTSSRRRLPQACVMECRTAEATLVPGQLGQKGMLGTQEWVCCKERNSNQGSSRAATLVRFYLDSVFRSWGQVVKQVARHSLGTTGSCPSIAQAQRMASSEVFNPLCCACHQDRQGLLCYYDTIIQDLM